ncbi:VOC family protein [Dyadobacter fermentans]|uniref:Glyoxalase/bleomycin resistance protein/dioxygenase n=1 Tax=Dyadobacter fermentans (strain ATCC 700827 / DSM 18053 / CIP 107007 / KCTC 52180 / NS114) TaxID=471854 RepID=C6VX81_DYAFD|nr:VOC family protein [Dyadobacter fermentans]ACT91554.1 Glyoxalase/bleomycin resistance protein/dioxygenase [Dyadobacter fermentans DSM 18053]
MATATSLRGFATVNFYAADLDAAKKWYSEVFEIPAYFEKPGYIEFRVGDYEHEMGVIDAKWAPPGATGSHAGAIIYWHVDNVEGAYQRLLDMGATSYQPVITRGEGFVTASVVDPFGNILGVMFNKHYLSVVNGN